MDKHDRYEELLDIIKSDQTPREYKEKAELELVALINERLSCDEFKIISEERIKERLRENMVGVLDLTINGDVVSVDLAELLEGALEYYSNCMPNPASHILSSHLEDLYNEVFGSGE